MDLKDTLIELLGDTGHEIIQSRPGDKLHELLLSRYELPTTRDLNDRYVILYPQMYDLPENIQNEIKDNYKDSSPAELNGEYSSDNVKLLSKDEIKEILISSGIDKID